MQRPYNENRCHQIFISELCFSIIQFISNIKSGLERTLAALFALDEPHRHNQNPALGSFCSATYKATAWREQMAIRPDCGLPT
ncbi:MAG: hypothetical protein QNJ68_15485 [Microcoleaceae cyanobacterium MO_207.B10]|nr:hypothetical protein [Microcoleaceae cyanobacterium MO_207.B10]